MAAKNEIGHRNGCLWSDKCVSAHAPEKTICGEKRLGKANKRLAKNYTIIEIQVELTQQFSHFLSLLHSLGISFPLSI